MSKTKTSDKTRFFKATYRTHAGEVIDEVYIEMSLQAAKDYALSKTGDDVELLRVKEYDSWVDATTDY